MVVFSAVTSGSYKENQGTGPQNRNPNVIGEQSLPLPKENTTKMNTLQNPLAKITLLGQPLSIFLSKLRLV